MRACFLRSAHALHLSKRPYFALLDGQAIGRCEEKGDRLLVVYK